MGIKTHEDLLAWQKSFELTKLVYQMTDRFPDRERFGLISQMRRAAVSVPSNIAEGYHRITRKEYKHFCHIAYGSANELHTQIRLAHALGYTKELDCSIIAQTMDSVLKLLNGLCRAL